MSKSNAEKMRGEHVALLFLIIGFAPAVAADSERMPFPHVKSSPAGDAYAKSVPEGFDRMKGKTYVYRVGNPEDELLYTYDWFASDVYPMGGHLVRLGPWARGQEASEDDLAIGFYLDGKMLREYSTLDIVNMAYDEATNISRSFSHYTVFKEVIGYQLLSMAVVNVKYTFDIKTHEDKLLSFNISTGTLRTEEEQERDRLLQQVESVKYGCYEKSSERTQEDKHQHVLTEEAFIECVKETKQYIPSIPEGYRLWLGKIYDEPKLEKIE